MYRKIRPSFIVTTCALAVGIAALAVAQPAREKSPQPELPPGWSAEDMQACVRAGTPGKMHEHLAGTVGVWHGKTQMWMAPGTEPARGECTWTITSIMDGRYTRADLDAELPGMGSFTGLGIAGFDNVSRKFVGSWIDTHSTGIMQGVGELSDDSKVLTWRYTYNCPIRKKPAVVREVHTYTGPDTMTFEMFTTEPRTGKEYRCMRVDFTRGT
jgi:hypothetical protein